MTDPCLGFADTPRARCEYYRKVCELPAVVDPRHGGITFRAGLVWGLMMASELGRRVKLELERTGRGGGPIVSHPRSGTWCFLVRSDIPTTRLTEDAALFRSGVRVIADGAVIALPSPVDTDPAYRAWISAAHSPFRPSGMSVLEAVGVCADRRLPLNETPSPK
ncbi:DNA-directed RNA polymerase subunit beta [Nocardia bovistercoris]|uniref:DNA-directed RNA polymerase subunit beta n=1 Tax=Nocardia bovistercoris TaxID=2785916 RepID=A0A931I8P7_9NOCA|nr:DNA-directed RNA polymerase subunit beta [Nocardia bovistercoris]MBH0775787.1 DNA-directed RNA polymerase subunit beta [Nocardia bovistercoris]